MSGGLFAWAVVPAREVVQGAWEVDLKLEFKHHKELCEVNKVALLAS